MSTLTPMRFQYSGLHDMWVGYGDDGNLVRMTDTTYQRLLRAAMRQYGIDNRTFSELHQFVLDTIATQQSFTKEVFWTKEFWATITDNNVVFIAKK